MALLVPFLSTFLYLQQLLFIGVKADDSITSGLFPNANLTVPLFTPNTNFRQNFCDIQSQFHNGEVEIRTAFEGRNLHVSLTVDPDYVYRNEDGSINLENPGLLVKLMDEIALIHLFGKIIIKSQPTKIGLTCFSGL
ncbi:predicted protein [Chaetoceros tenuissimus]|uniref:Uncharacterized protein n=1 Tax=Chaetoceros tenuissimus TaxID=426638 RepID=A0AAD3D0J8_9STRA|nr:predicted protein [Chaetoceros tenuissimus]